jgi:hypothetical protein
MAFNPEPIPDGAALAPHHFYVGIGIAVFGFLFVWWVYPRTGATLALVGLLVALDDVVQHAFQVRTPLHFVWWGVVYPVIRAVEAF